MGGDVVRSIDYHGTFANYRDAKKGFFDSLPRTAFALTNADDRNGAVMLQNTPARRATYSLRSGADFRARLVDNSLAGLELELDGREVHFRLIGVFNAYNLLGVYGAAVLLGEEPTEVLTILSGLTTAPGRFEPVTVPGQGILGLVDYAHTPDALENVLQTLQQTRRPGQRIITVVGCGGNRDAAKRPVMARLAAQLSDEVILTADNPRDEDPLDILSQMQAGLTPPADAHTQTIADRRAAIQAAVALARPGDLVLLAGKGHETYQEIRGVKTHFDDREELRAALTSTTI